MTKTKGELIGTLCFGKEGLEKKDLRNIEAIKRKMPTEIASNGI